MKTTVRRTGIHAAWVVYVIFALRAIITGSAFAQDPSPVAVMPTDGGAIAAVDVLAGRNAEGKRERSWWEAVKTGVWENKGKIATGAAAGALTVYLIDEAGDDGKKKVKTPKAPPVKPDPTTGSTQTATAGGNTSQTSYNAGGDIVINYGAPK